MYHRRRRRLRNTYYHADSEKPQKNILNTGKQIALLILVAVIVFLACSMSFLKDLSAQIAASDASDIVTVQINNAISEIMSEGDYAGDYFVSFVTNDSGDITGVSSNMARINALSSKILDRVVGATEGRTITVSIPLGNLTGISLLMGRGPGVPVKIIVLTSSKVEFKNSVFTAGINQTNQQISLEVIVDVDILIPWETVSTQVTTEILIADNVVVGRVPETYLNMQ